MTTHRSFLQNIFRKAFSGVLIATMIMSGCTTTGGNPVTQTIGKVYENTRQSMAQALKGFQAPRDRYINSVPDDSCANLREPFVEVLETQRRELQKWAAIGAVTGSATGAAVNKNNRLAGWTIGLVTGAFMGAIVGYNIDLKKRVKDTENLRNTVFTDARGDVNSSDKLVKGVAGINSCRMKKLKAIAADIQKGTITKDVARSQINAVKISTEEDNKLITSVSKGLRKRSAIYVNALKKSGADDADVYITKAEAYKPVVKKPQFAVQRGRVKPISISRRSKRSETSVESVAKNAVELDALQVAHLEAVDEGIEDIYALLL